MPILLFAIREWTKSGLLFRDRIFNKDICKLFFSHFLLLDDIGCDAGGSWDDNVSWGAVDIGFLWGVWMLSGNVGFEQYLTYKI